MDKTTNWSYGTWSRRRRSPRFQLAVCTPSKSMVTHSMALTHSAHSISSLGWSCSPLRYRKSKRRSNRLRRCRRKGKILNKWYFSSLRWSKSSSFHMYSWYPAFLKTSSVAHAKNQNPLDSSLTIIWVASTSYPAQTGLLSKLSSTISLWYFQSRMDSEARQSKQSAWVTVRWPMLLTPKWDISDRPPGAWRLTYSSMWHSATRGLLHCLKMTSTCSILRATVSAEYLWTGSMYR